MLTAAHQDWLSARALDVEVATRHGLESVARKHSGQPYSAISIPYTRSGVGVGSKYRCFDHPDGQRWMQDKGGVGGLWNEDTLRDPTLNGEPLIITEGEWDALAALQCGFQRVVSVPNGANTKLELAEPLKPHLTKTRRIILAGDGDEPGRALNEELARRFGAARCNVIEYPPRTKDLNDVLAKFGPSVVETVIAGARPYPIKGLYTLDAYSGDAEPEVFDTGWPCLNNHLRMWRGEFMVVTGVPGHGKSRFALELLGSLNRKHGHKAVIASFEMPIVPYVRDVLREHYHGIVRANLTDEQKREADAWIRANFCFIDQDPRDETEDADIDWIIDKAEDAVFRFGCDWFLLDPWNQVEHKRGRFETETDYHSRAIRALKRFAKSYQCGVIVVAHPTKGVQQVTGGIRKPTLYDISGSAHWYNAADHGAVVWGHSLSSDVREVDIAKSRYAAAGRPGSGYLRLADGRLRGTAPG